MNIRLATVDDLQRIHEIAVAGWTPIFERFRLIMGDRMWNDVWRGWEANWFAPNPEKFNGRTIVTEWHGRVAGFATWWFHSERFAEVGGNAVDPDSQGHGIGSRQTQWVVDMFRREGYRCAKVHTGMDPAHGPARAEYRKAGLRHPVLNSVYLNYLDEVAQIPVPKSLAFRSASAEDETLIKRIVDRAWPPVYEAVRGSVGDEIFEIAFEDALGKRTGESVKRLEESPEAVRIVSENGEAAGFCVLGSEEAKGIGEIRALGVDPEYQRRGIGAALCMDAFDIFRERGLSYARLKAELGEVHWQTRQLCWNVGLYRQLPSVDYYMML